MTVTASASETGSHYTSAIESTSSYASTSDLSTGERATATPSRSHRMRENAGSPVNVVHEQSPDVRKGHAAPLNEHEAVYLADQPVSYSSQHRDVLDVYSSQEQGDGHLHATRDLLQGPNKDHAHGPLSHYSEAPSQYIVGQDSTDSPVTPRKSAFIKTGSSMPSSSHVKQQLWESGGESNTSTMVGSTRATSSFIRKHLKTASGDSVFENSRRSSSSASASREEATKRESVDVVQSTSDTKREDGLHEVIPSHQASGPDNPTRPAPWTAQDRPRSGSTLRFQHQPAELRRSPSRGTRYQAREMSSSSAPQLSPMVPLLFQPDLPLEMVTYTNCLARIVHTLYPLFYHSHVLVTLFLDFNVLYALVQVASHPSPEGADIPAGTGITIAGTPRVNPWWIALAFYALSTCSWFIVVFLIHDTYLFYHKVWKNRKDNLCMHRETKKRH